MSSFSIHGINNICDTFTNLGGGLGILTWQSEALVAGGAIENEGMPAEERGLSVGKSPLLEKLDIKGERGWYDGMPLSENSNDGKPESSRWV